MLFEFSHTHRDVGVTHHNCVSHDVVMSYDMEGCVVMLFDFLLCVYCEINTVHGMGSDCCQ